MRGFVYAYDKLGQPISIERYGELRMLPDYYRVGLTDVGPYQVSTVWLGFDHRFGIDIGAPIIFETMVFADNPDVERPPIDVDSMRYCTEDQARAGHEEIVTLIRATTQFDADEILSDEHEGSD